jgi:hypothetical protein
MIRVWGCDTCRRVYEVGGSEEEIQELLGSTETYPCITPLCRGVLHRVSGPIAWSAVAGLPLEEIPLRSFFRAVMGFGKFEGAAAECQKVIELLMGNNVVSVDARPIGNPERTVVNQIVLVDGTRLHFASSSHGACCYYIEGSGPSCVEVLDAQSNLVSPETDSCRNNPDREEVGRGHE